MVHSQPQQIDGHVFNSYNRGFMAAVVAASKAATRGPVQTLWTNILSTWFTPTCYIIGFKEWSLADVSVLEVRYIPPTASSCNDEVEPRIFMVQYWSAAADAPGCWQAARLQSARYMRDNVAPGRRMLCAIGIGAKVELYVWDGSLAINPFEQVHIGTIDLMGTSERRKLERHLSYIETHGLDFATPTKPWSNGS